MTQIQSTLSVVDNTGIRKVRCLRPVGRTKAGIGDRITVSVVKALPTSNWRAGRVRRALVVRTKGSWRKPRGRRVRFEGENAAVRRSPEGVPLGTRVRGVVPRELRGLGYAKVVTRAEGTV